MEEEQQFRFTDEIRKEFEELAKNTDDENKKIQIGIVINFLTAVEQQLQLVEGSDAKDFIDTSALYDNLILGRDELIGLRGNKPKIQPEKKDVLPENTPITEETLKEMDQKLKEQTGGMRASPNSEFMKNYIKEYIKVEKLMLTPLNKFIVLVENMYRERTINDDKLDDLKTTFTNLLNQVSYILRIVHQGSENNEQNFLIQTDNIEPRSVYLLIMQTIFDMITLVVKNVNYLDDPAQEARNKQVFMALYNDWKYNMSQNRDTPENAFERGQVYSDIEDTMSG
jgi:hypothetical protein